MEVRSLYYVNYIHFDPDNSTTNIFNQSSTSPAVNQQYADPKPSATIYIPLTTQTSPPNCERDTTKTPSSIHAPRVSELAMNLDLSPAIPTMVHGWKEFDESAPGVTTTEQTPKPIKLDMDIGPIELDMDIDTA